MAELKKYMLIASCGMREDDDGTVDVYSLPIGFFDTYEEALEEAKEDLIGEAQNQAECLYDPEDDEEDYNNFVSEYTEQQYVSTYPDEELETLKIGDQRPILESSYYAASWAHIHTYYIVKLN